MQLGGVYTIANFGDKTIHQGDLVVWNAPILAAVNNGRPHVDETPDGKLVIATEPYDPLQVFGWTSLKAKIEKGKLDAQTIVAKGQPNQTIKPYSTIDRTIAYVIYTLATIFDDNNPVANVQRLLSNPDRLIAKLEPMFDAMAQQRAEYNSRIVGRSLRTALPGNNLRIYMQNSCI